MLHRLTRQDALRVIVLQHFVEQVQRILRTKGLIIGLDEL